MDDSTDKRIGQFLIENEIINEEQLNEALELQKDNPERLVGEVLVTLGTITKETLIMSLEMFMIVNDVLPDHVDEWLDQEEIDLLLDRTK